MICQFHKLILYVLCHPRTMLHEWTDSTITRNLEWRRNLGWTRRRHMWRAWEERQTRRRRCYGHKIGRGAASSRKVPSSDLMSLALNSAVRTFSRVPFRRPRSRHPRASHSSPILLSLSQVTREESEPTVVTHMLQRPFAFKSFVYGPRRFIGCAPIYI